MSGPERYPLEALRTLRAEEEDARKRGLADAARAHDDAVRAAERAVARRREHEEETARIAADERARDGAGRAVTEMLRAESWMARRRTESGALEKSIAAARASAEDAARGVDDARAKLGEARAEREAIERHHADWIAEKRKAVEKREEDEADERNAHTHRR